MQHKKAANKKDGIIHRAYKVEIDPTKAQVSIFHQYMGTARFVWNKALGLENEAYEQTGKRLGWVELNRRLTQWRGEPELEWLKAVPRSIGEVAIEGLEQSFKTFFRRPKEKQEGRLPKDEKIEAPKFRKKFGRGDNFTVKDHNGYIRVEPERVRLPKIGYVKLKEHDYIPGPDRFRTLRATISTRAGRWFLSINGELEAARVKVPSDGPILGIDLGVTKLATVSDGAYFGNPKALAHYQKKKARLQRKMSRQWEANGKKPGENWKKTKARVAKVDYKIANLRKDTIQNMTTTIVHKAPSVLGVEDLNVKRMMVKEEGETRRQRAARNRGLADAAMAEIKRQLEYKAKWLGIGVVKVDPRNTSQTCSRCGTVKEGSARLSLYVRTFKCGNCGLTLDRDLNAARNVAKEAKNLVRRRNVSPTAAVAES